MLYLPTEKMKLTDFGFKIFKHHELKFEVKQETQINLKEIEQNENRIKKQVLQGKKRIID